MQTKGICRFRFAEPRQGSAVFNGSREPTESSQSSVRDTQKRTREGCVCVVRTKGLAPLAARPAPTLLTSSFANKLIFILALQGKAFCSRKTALLAQSCSLRSVTFTPTYRRSLISHLQDVINALLNGQLVPRGPSYYGSSKKMRYPHLGYLIFLSITNDSAVIQVLVLT